MKMKKIFTCLAMLLCTSYAMAEDLGDEFSIADVTVQQGGSVDFEIKYKVTAVSAPLRVGYTVQLAFPRTGFSFEREMDEVYDEETGDPTGEVIPGAYIYTKGNGVKNLDVTINANYEDNKENDESKVTGYQIQGMPNNKDSKITVKGPTTLLKFTLCADASVPAGEYIVNVGPNKFQTKQDASAATLDEDVSDFTFKITVLGRTVLDEASTEAPAAEEGADVLVKRTINPDVWSTICLPVAVGEDVMDEAFGEGWKLADFVGIDATEEGGKVTEIDVQFEEVSSIEANHPYIIKVAQKVESFTLDAVDISPDEANACVVVDGSGFYGVYTNGTVLDANKLFLSGGTFWYATDTNPVTSKAFRGYFNLAKVLSSFDASARATITIGDETTDISNFVLEVNDGEYYDLQGRRVNTPTKGLYIQNGKKVIVK